MSSLMQFDGATGPRGALLEFSRGVVWTPEMRMLQVEPVPCTLCEKPHEQLYVAWRKPCGMLGCWVRFRFNGEVHAPDLSVPITVNRVPRDARKLTREENSRYWHRS